jgi:hypothetical protein
VRAQDSDAFGIAEYAGEALRIAQPLGEQEVFAGDSMAVVVEIVGDVEVELVIVVFPGGAAFLDKPPFRTAIQIPIEDVGPMTIGALGKTTDGHMVSAPDVTVDVDVRARLDRISTHDESLSLDGPGDVCSIRVSGHYNDDVTRDITNYHTSYKVITGGELACVTDRGVIVGRAPGDAVVHVSHGTYDKTVHVTVGGLARQNNAPDATLLKTYQGSAGTELCISARDCSDVDACLGEALSAESFRWTLDFDFAKYEGVGWEFCLVPKEAGYGFLELTVTDRHDASSSTFATVVIK